MALNLILSGDTMETALSELEARQYSPLTLAFLGDSVYEILVREALVREANTSVKQLHSTKIQYVCAGFQAKAVNMLLPFLTDEEQAVYHRGRNAGGTPSKNADPADYRKATGFEALFGYLQLMGQQDRIQTLFTSVWNMRTDILNHP